MVNDMNVGTEKISVIMPVYNTEKYLEESVRSIMGQTYRNLEIICVDDGSTDGSAQILERLAGEDDRIVVISQENTGQGAARNAGLKAATAEWISFIDSDDTLREDAYELISKAFDSRPDMIHFGIEMVLDEGMAPRKSDEKYYAVEYDGLEELTDSHILRSDGSASNKLFRKSVIDRYGIRFENILYEDFQFSTQYMSISSRVFYIPEKLYRYLRRGDSTMSETFRRTPKSIDHLYALNYVCEFMAANGNLEHHRRLVRKLFVTYYKAAIRHSTPEMIPEIVDYATRMHSRYAVIARKVERRMENGCVVFALKGKRKVLSKVIQKIFSLRYEFIDYRPYKVMRIFDIIVYKEAR